MEDKLLKMFFDPERWEYAIAKGVGKDISKNWLYQLCKEEVRLKMYKAIKAGEYEIAPPHTAQIPKETKGEFRTVYVNEAADRVFLSIANDLLFELMADKVHPACKSYLKGIGCGKIVKEVSSTILKYDVRSKTEDVHQPSFIIHHPSAIRHQTFVGWKSDLSKYFDSVPIRFIDAAFDDVEQRHGKSALIDVLRKYYHSDLYFDTDGHLQSQYQSLKQGCSVASWLADVLLCDIDDKLSKMQGYYVRYSDDMLYIGEDYEQAMAVLCDELAVMDMKLNPKKVELLSPDHWFKFLGFSIRGKDISMSSSRLKKFQKEIEKRCLTPIPSPKGEGRKYRLPSFQKALNSVNRYLYHGDGQGHSWATGILGVVNVKEDIDTMNAFVMDCLRAVYTGKTKVGGLGYDKQGKVGCIVRGKGRNVSANRRKTGDDISGYISLGCMQNAIRTSRAAYDTLVRETHPHPLPVMEGRNHQQSAEVSTPLAHREGQGGESVSIEMLEAAYATYKYSVPSEKDMGRTHRFYALPVSELSDEDMMYGMPRDIAEAALEFALADFAYPETAGWFWQSENDPDLVVLRSWLKPAA